MKIKSIKLLQKNQVEVITASKNYYFSKDNKSIVMDIFDAKIKNNSKAYIESINFTVKNFNASKNIGKKANNKVRLYLELD